MGNTIAVSVLAAEPLREVGITAMLEWLPELSVRPFSTDVPSDVVVADLSSLVVQTLGPLRKASQKHGSVAVIVTDGGAADPDAMFEAGVVTVLHVTEATQDHLQSAIRNAAAMDSLGVVVTRDDLIDQIRRLATITGGDPARPVLSEREITVLRHLAAGLETNEIMKAMNVSERTLKYILWCIMSRLSLRNRVHAVAFAIRAGLI
ncbi:LuxR C-terminal-related transcriptional regulator [Actinoplanes sp. NPDC051470]|uniref:response regulator transcription factor n=1 Tax=Actinoplanes sp. NPDC051470 TaxID=3157224 RepID=UPI0034398DA3